MIDMTVREVMSAPVQTIAASATLGEAASTLTDHGIGSLVVLDDGDALAGILTDADVVAAVADQEGAARDTDVEAVMSAPLVTMAPGRSVHDAADMMGDHCVKKLPIVDDEEPIGIVTTTDLALYLPRYKLDLLESADEGAA